MWIERLSLKNFRGFRALELDLNRRLTLLIGENGSGKSSIVDALAAVEKSGQTLSHDLGLSDIRVGAELLEVHLSSRYGEDSIEFDGAPRIQRVGPQRVLSMRVGRARLLFEGRQHHVKGKSNPPSTQEWFREREDLENEIRVRTRDFDAQDDALALVRGAVGELLPGLSNPRIEREYFPGESRLVLDKAGTTLSSDMLSEGEKSLLALGVEIARFLSAFRDEDVPISERSATIVIDEIELHLHPRWQRVVVPRLLAAFPGCQFIITTHSPQVIGSVDAESLFILEDFQVHPANYLTKGRDSNAVLEELMGASARDPDTEDELQAAARLVEVGPDDEAEAAVQKLAERFGEDDREVVRLRTALMLRGA